ncbi:TetR/AcrR family transcriptional regulator [Streptomyces sp. NPDC056987]|uniref:TetR/AcrR family transcriptional regulator n=1 Tax=Streptomyces sp. NPDC056987 TaxID=3345988 RepID=UPI00363CBB6B
MRRDAFRNQELILRAAREVLSTRGADAGMDLIAAEAGVGIGTLYRHFPNRDAILDALVRAMFDDLLVAAEDALARGDGTGLEIFLRAMCQSMADRHGYADRFAKSITSEVVPKFYRAIDELLEQAKAAHRISPDVTLADLRVLIFGIRGVVAATGSFVPQAWERHLDIHLAGLRMEPVPSRHPSLTAEQLAAIFAEETA